MTTYYSDNNLFAYTVSSNSSYTLDSADYSIIADVFNRWDSLVSPDSRFGENYQITVSMTIDALGAGILGGTSVSHVASIGSQSFGNTLPYTASITLNDSYVISMKSDVRDTGKTEYYYVLLHEVGHVLGIGTFWGHSGAPVVSYQEDGLTKYLYTGQHAVREYKRHLSPIANDIVGIPIEDNGSAGTVNVHPEEGNEAHVSQDKRYINGVFHPGLDSELMTGWMEGTPQSTPLSRITLGFLEDIGFNVNYNLADYYRPMTDWLDLSNNANCFKSIYEQGFVDLSGGSIQTRNEDQKLIIAGDSSLNNAYLGEIRTIMVDGTTVVDVNITGTVANMISQHSADETTHIKDFLAISGDGKTYAIWHYNGYNRLYVYKDLGDGNGYTKIVNDFIFPSDMEGQVKLNYDGTKMLLTAIDDLQSHGGNNDGGLAIVLEYDPTKTTSNNDYTHSGGILPANYGPENWKIMGNAIFGPDNGHLGDVMDNQNENISISDDGLTIAFGVWDGVENAYIYTWNGSAWNLKGSIISEPSSVSNFGKFLSLSGDGNSIIVGSDNDKHWVFKWSGTAWEQQGGYIDITGANYQRSQAINTDGTVIAVGDMGSTGEEGTIKIFDRNPSDTNANHVGWTQRGNTISDTSQDVLLGMNVYITSDGNMIATRMWNSTSQKNIYKYNSSNATWDNLPYDSNVDSNGLIRHVALSKFGTHIALINHNTSKVQVHEIEGENVYEQIPTYSGHMSVGCDTYTPNAIDISGTMDICGNLFSSGDISLNSGVYTTVMVPGTASNGATITGSRFTGNTTQTNFTQKNSFSTGGTTDDGRFFMNVGGAIYNGSRYDYFIWQDKFEYAQDWGGYTDFIRIITDSDGSVGGATDPLDGSNVEGQIQSWTVSIFDEGDVVCVGTKYPNNNPGTSHAYLFSNCRSAGNHSLTKTMLHDSYEQYDRFAYSNTNNGTRSKTLGFSYWYDGNNEYEYRYWTSNAPVTPSSYTGRITISDIGSNSNQLDRLPFLNTTDNILYLWGTCQHLCIVDMSEFNAIGAGSYNNWYLNNSTAHTASWLTNTPNTRIIPYSDFPEISINNNTYFSGYDNSNILIINISSISFLTYLWDSNQSKYVYTGIIPIPSGSHISTIPYKRRIFEAKMNSLTDASITFGSGGGSNGTLFIYKVKYNGTKWNTEIYKNITVDTSNFADAYNEYTTGNSSRGMRYTLNNNVLTTSGVERYNSNYRYFTATLTLETEDAYAQVSSQQEEPSAKLFIGNDCSVNGNITYTNLSIDNINVSYPEDTNMSTNLKVNNINNGSGTTTTSTNITGTSLTHISANYDSTTDSIHGIVTGSLYMSHNYYDSIGMNDSGSRIIMGDATANSNDGNVVIYENQSGTWIKIGDMDGPASPNDSYFGISVDMNSDGSTIIIGAYNYDDTSNGNQGMIQVYTYSGSGTTWNQKGSNIIGGGTNNYFGYIVKINNDGTRIFTSTLIYDRVIIWDYNSGTASWDEIGNVSIGNTVGSLSINNTGSRFVAGKNTDEGEVLIYEYSGSGSSWTKIGEFTASDTGTNQDYEYVDMNSDGNIIAITGIDSSILASPESVESYGGGTKVYEYSGSGTTWNQKGDTIYGPHAGYPKKPRLNSDGTVLLIGYPSYNSSGAILIYSYISDTWTLIKEEIGNVGGGNYGRQTYLLKDGTKYAASSGNVGVKIYDITYTGSTTTTSNPISLQIHGDLDSTPTFSANVDVSHNIIVPGNITIIDSSANNYGAYTVYTTKDASTHFSVGKSASNVFNIVNQNNAGVYMVSGNNSLTSTSDVRLKKEIEPLEDATERIMKLNPCTYKWKTQTDEKRHVGFIAQEVEEVFPELVRETTYPGGSTYKGVATEDFVGYLIKVMENQENELNLLKEKMK